MSKREHVDSNGQNLLPDWWSSDLYYFLNDIPIEGWVWEFMRRARLKEVLGSRPVDAMNPEPNTECINGFDINCYKQWTHPYWAKKPPFLIPSAVTVDGEWPARFQGQQYSVFNEAGRNLAKINVDLNRRNHRIIKDFKETLGFLRKKHHEIKRLNVRKQDWLGAHVLEVWDLRELKVSWSDIQSVLKINSIQQVRNAFKTAQDNIDKGKWRLYVRNFENW